MLRVSLCCQLFPPCSPCALLSLSMDQPISLVCVFIVTVVIIFIAATFFHPIHYPSAFHSFFHFSLCLHTTTIPHILGTSVYMIVLLRKFREYHAFVNPPICVRLAMFSSPRASSWLGGLDGIQHATLVEATQKPSVQSIRLFLFFGPKSIYLIVRRYARSIHAATLGTLSPRTGD